MISEPSSFQNGWVTYFRLANAKGRLQRMGE
jgi:hypothetical protein